MLDPCSTTRNGPLQVTVLLKSDNRTELRSADAKAMASRMAQVELPRCAWSRYGAQGYMTKDGQSLNDADLINPDKTKNGFYTQEYILKGMP